MAEMTTKKDNTENRRFCRCNHTAFGSRKLPGSICWLPILFVCLIFNFEVFAQEEKFDPLQNRPAWHIKADEVQYDQGLEQYLATGRVVITREDLRMTADRVRFDPETMEAFAEGNVMLISGRDIITGKRMEMDLNKQTGAVFDGTVFIEENHFFIRGEHLVKTGKDSYQAGRASITSCGGDDPDWKITARNVRVSVEGYGTASHTALWAADIPVLYSPYLVFPVKLKRQTGFLTPEAGYSDRKGTEYIQPFFWAIDESSDATFYEHFMSRRGNKIGAEYRYILSSETRGAVMADVLKDRKVDDGTENSSEKWGYTDDAYLRPNEDRYWFRMTHDQELPGDFSARLDLDIVSDQDYLQEFKNGYSGYNETKAYFLKEFARDLDDYNDPVRVNQLRINKKWDYYNFNAQTLWYDDVIKRRREDRDTTLQRLPSLGFDATRQPLLGSSLYYDLISDYTYFFREDSYTGHRMDIYPRFYVPFKYKHYFALESSVGLRETLWYLDDREEFSNDGDHSFSRHLADLKLDLSTELARSYSLSSATGKKLQHIIRPQVVYDFTPPTSQQRLPLFDEADRINKTSIATYALTNTFFLRSKIFSGSGSGESQSPLTPSGQTGSGSDSYVFQPLCRLKIQQSYDFNETIESRPFSPIFAELDFTPGHLLYLRAETYYSTYENSLLRNNIALSASNQRGDRIFLEHRYTKDFQETLYGDAVVKLHDRISMVTKYEKNIKDSETLLYGFGFLYMASCWSLDVGYSKEDRDQKFALRINLYGLGGLGEAYAGEMVQNPFEYRQNTLDTSHSSSLIF